MCLPVKYTHTHRQQAINDNIELFVPTQMSDIVCVH